MEAALLERTAGRRWVIYDKAFWLVSHPGAAKADGHTLAARQALRVFFPARVRLTTWRTSAIWARRSGALANSALLANAEDPDPSTGKTADQLSPTATALGLHRRRATSPAGARNLVSPLADQDRSFVVQHRNHPVEQVRDSLPPPA